MTAAIYINEGLTQIVLTPENEWEKNALKMIESSGKVSTFYGGFYYCQGGWIREQYADQRDSLIFVIDKRMEELPT
jgi:hypothetical protein